MSDVRYTKERCQKEKERNRNVKHCVTEPYHYATEITSHEKCAETSSNINYECARQSIRSKTNRSAKNVASKIGSKTTKILAGNRCYPRAERVAARQPCKDDFVWQGGKYVQDECGSGIQPTTLDSRSRNREWCKTPLTMYQSTIGELARKMLCSEIKMPKTINGSPPCNVCEYVLPLCRGYYRKYGCRRKCEEEQIRFKNGEKMYRDVVQQYWMPCLTNEEKHTNEISKYVGHNEFLGRKLRRKVAHISCW